MSTPCAIVLDTETTGLYDGKHRSPPDVLEIIELGAVVIDLDFNILDEFEMLVNPGEYIANHPQAHYPFKLTGLTASELLSKGVPPEAAASSFAEWSRRAAADLGARKATAYHNVFDFWFLDRSPWLYFERTKLERGRCIAAASQDVMGPRGALQRPTVGNLIHDPTAKWKRPSADEASEYFRGLGYPIPSFGGGRHRALPDARVEAAVMVAIVKEEMKA
jgi:DNA polymerase III epsilon subunit-like protein